jgi:hypothetical protein
MKFIHNKLGNEDQQCFSKSSKKNLFPFCKNLLDTYLKPEACNEK